MPDEVLIAEIENILSEVVRLGGENERSQMVPNLSVINASPGGSLDGFVIVSDDRDGDNIVARKVGSVIYTNGDKVNVIFPKGGEAIAYQQGSESANSGIWEIVPSTSTDIYFNKGGVGIGTSTPTTTLDVYQDIGGRVAIGRADTTITNGEILGVLWFSGDDPSAGTLRAGTGIVSVAGGTWSADNYPGYISFRTNAGAAAPTETMRLDQNGNLGIGTSGADARLDVLDTSGAQIRLTFEDGIKFVDFTLDTNHDLTITPSSTGQVILQPTTDSTDFFQVLDADGGTPILNVDTTNERVGIGTSGPVDLVDIRSATGANMTLGRADTTITNGETLGAIWFAGDDPSAGTRRAGAGIVSASAGTWSTNNYPGYLRFFSNAGAASASENMRLDENGDLGVGTTGPSAQLHVDQGSATGAQPVLYLDQADISEEIIWYRGESAAGTADQSLVDASDFTTPGALLGWIKNKIDDQRVGGLGTIDVWIPFYAIPTA